MANNKAPVLFRIVGAGLLALGLFTLARSVIWGKGFGEDFPPLLSGFASLLWVLAGLWFVGAERLLGRHAPPFDWSAFWGGGLAMNAGGFLMAVSVLDPRDEAFHGPRWLVAAGGLIFVLGGVLALRMGTGLARKEGDLAGGLLALLMLTTFGVVFSWAAFGPGERQFEGGMSILFFSTSFGSGETGGRIAFGVAAVLLDVMALFSWAAVFAGLWKWIRQRRG